MMSMTQNQQKKRQLTDPKICGTKVPNGWTSITEGCISYFRQERFDGLVIVTNEEETMDAIFLWSKENAGRMVDLCQQLCE